MSQYRFLSIIWGSLGVFFFFFYLRADDPYSVTNIVLLLLSSSSVFVSAVGLWRGLAWARILIGLIAVVFAAGCVMAIWVRDWWGTSGFMDALLVSGVCLSVYTLYVSLKGRAN